MGRAPSPRRDSLHFLTLAQSILARSNRQRFPSQISLRAIRALDTERVAARRGAAHVDVIHVRASKKLFDSGIHGGVLDILRRHQSPSSRVTVQCPWTLSQYRGKSAIFRIAFARLRMDVHRAWQRQRFAAFERVIGK